MTATTSTGVVASLPRGDHAEIRDRVRPVLSRVELRPAGGPSRAE
jgi:hypothetical protein